MAPDGSLAPIFILADDDERAVRQILGLLSAEWYFIPVSVPRLVVRYASRFSTTAIFLADPIDYPNGGAVRLLQELQDKVGKPVVIMTERWEPEIRLQWRRTGAFECIPHPTRIGQRVETLRALTQRFALDALAGPCTSRPSGS